MREPADSVPDAGPPAAPRDADGAARKASTEGVTEGTTEGRGPQAADGCAVQTNGAGAVWRDPLLLAATTFGLGGLRPAPGTWGSLPPVVLAGAMVWLGADRGTLAIAMGILAIGFSLITVLAGGRAEQRWGKDPSPVVADETAGQALALLWLPETAIDGIGSAALWLSGSFVAFRIMDIIKVFPAGACERLPRGWGILLDDLVVGAYVLAGVHVVAAVV